MKICGCLNLLGICSIYILEVFVFSLRGKKLNIFQFVSFKRCLREVFDYLNFYLVYNERENNYLDVFSVVVAFVIGFI